MCFGSCDQSHLVLACTSNLSDILADGRIVYTGNKINYQVLRQNLQVLLVWCISQNVQPTLRTLEKLFFTKIDNDHGILEPTSHKNGERKLIYQHGVWQDKHRLWISMWHCYNYIELRWSCVVLAQNNRETSELSILVTFTQISESSPSYKFNSLNFDSENNICDNPLGPP